MYTKRDNTISIVIPIYQVEDYLRRCVSSVIAQEIMEYNVCLVDDGTLDKSSILCDEYAFLDDRFIAIHQRNGGLSLARNVGIEFFSLHTDYNGYITFLDSDDWIHPAYLGMLYRACVENKASIAISRFKLTNGSDQINITNETEELPPETFYVKDRMCATTAWGKLYSFSLWQKIRFPMEKKHEDEYITYKLLFSQKTIIILNDKLYFYYINQNGIMSNENVRSRLDLYEAQREQIEWFTQHGYNKARFASIIEWEKTRRCLAFAKICFNNKIESNRFELSCKERFLLRVVLFRDAIQETQRNEIEKIKNIMKKILGEKLSHKISSIRHGLR